MNFVTVLMRLTFDVGTCLSDVGREYDSVCFALYVFVSGDALQQVEQRNVLKKNNLNCFITIPK